MMLSIDDIFKILNFGVVCSLLIYIMRHYGILYIVSAMRHQKQKQEHLQDEHQLLLQEAALIQQQSEDQELEHAAIEHKFEIWQKQVQLEKNAYKNQVEHYRIMFEQQQIIKLENVHRQTIIKEQFPFVLTEVTEELRKHFDSDEHHKKAYVDKLVLFLKEKQ